MRALKNAVADAELKMKAAAEHAQRCQEKHERLSKLRAEALLALQQAAAALREAEPGTPAFTRAVARKAEATASVDELTARETQAAQELQRAQAEAVAAQAPYRKAQAAMDDAEIAKIVAEADVASAAFAREQAARIIRLSELCARANTFEGLPADARRTESVWEGAPLGREFATAARLPSMETRLGKLEVLRNQSSPERAIRFAVGHEEAWNEKVAPSIAERLRKPSKESRNN